MTTRRLGPLVTARCAAALAGLVWLAGGTVAPAQPLTLRTDDGVVIGGELYLPEARPAPAVLLLHMLGRSRADWGATAEQLAAAGFVALAIDLRGHGASGEASVWPDDLTPSLLDVKAARQYLAGRTDLCTGAVGIAGAQVGANLAVLAAAPDPSVRSLVLLSAGLDYRRLRIETAMQKYGGRPALLLASTEDAYAARSARALAGLGGGIRDLRLVNGAGHGTVMLARRPDLMRVLVDWFRRTLL